MQIVRNFLGEEINIIKEKELIWFWGVEVANLLGYVDADAALRRHVDPIDKRIAIRTPRRSAGVIRRPTTRAYQVNEVGVYGLIFGSKLPRAKEFRRWVFHDVLPSIRKTGEYVTYNQLSILNETDLHYAIIREIRSRYPHLVLVVQAGELQDTSSKRSIMWRKGFTGGQPDVMITNPHKWYNGFAIEVKTPKGTGVVSEKQNMVLERYRCMGWKISVCTSLVDIMLELDKYVQGVREICPRCRRLFKTERTLISHLEGFHSVPFY